MKIEIEKLVRDKWNRFYTVKKIYDKFIGTKENGKPLYLTNIIKVANTPMELLQDEDLIRYKMYVGSNQVVTKSIPLAVCRNMKGEVMIYAASMLIPHNLITDILTPNQDGGYDLQYSKEVDVK